MSADDPLRQFPVAAAVERCQLELMMIKFSRRAVLLSAISAAAILSAGPASAQEMPEGTLTIVVPFPAGSMITTTTRLLVPELEKELGRTIVVENHPGAATVLGTEHVLRAPRDGKTLLVMSNSFFVNGALRPDLSYVPLRDFKPVALMASLSHALVARPDFKGDLEAFIAAAKKAGDRPFKFGAAPGTSNHLLSAEFLRITGIKAAHIPYTGAAPAYTDLMGGRLDFMFASIGDAVQPVASGKMQALALAAKESSPKFPGVPTLAEKKIPVVLTDAVYGVVAPADIPADVLKKWQSAFQTALAKPEIREKISSWALQPGGGDVEKFDSELKAYSEKSAEIVKELGLKVDK